MKIVKKILMFLLLLIVIALVAALFVKKSFVVERQVTINKSNQVVFDYIKYVKNQDNFSVWNKKDPNMKKEYKGTDGTVGFLYAWDSEDKNVGKGEQEIANIVEGKRMDMNLHFKVPFEAHNNAYFTTEAVDSNQTKVTWGLAGKMPYPMNLMSVFCNMDKMIGGDLGTGLDNLKALLEKQ